MSNNNQSVFNYLKKLIYGEEETKNNNKNNNLQNNSKVNNNKNQVNNENLNMKKITNKEIEALMNANKPKLTWSQKIATTIALLMSLSSLFFFFLLGLI
jgi:uncharacterized membrane protein YcjF (UPF0283 family)